MEDQANITIEQAIGLLESTGLHWSQSKENAGWFFVVPTPSTVIRVWFEDVPEFINRKEG
jgi:hypothetical protein